MLASNHKELLTAFVDGELTARQRRHVLRLLRRSGEARRLLQRLQQDSRNIIALPACVPPADVSGMVLDTIARRKLRPASRQRLSPPVRFPLWTGVAAAASVLLLVGLGSFLHYSSGPTRTDNGVVHLEVKPDDSAAPAVPNEKAVARTTETNTEPKEEPTPPAVLPEEPEDWDFLRPRPRGTEPVVPPTKPIPPSPPAPVLASGEKEVAGKLERVEIAMPVLFRLADLQQADQAGKFRDRLAAPGAYRVELLCKDATRSFDRVRSAFSVGKINLLVDATARARLKKPLYHNHYAVFLENVTPEEVVNLLARMQAADRAPPADKKSLEPRFEGTVVVKEMSSWDRGELAKLLCVRELGAKSPSATRSTGLDIHKPLPEITESEVADALDGKGVPRNVTQDRNAVFLSLSGSRTATPELRRFMESRKPYRPGTIQLFLVLRHVGP